MRFIGQFIQNFISRFRSDVYLENIADGTVANDKFLGLDSNNKIVKEAITSGSGDITSVEISVDDGGSIESASGAAVFALKGGGGIGTDIADDGSGDIEISHSDTSSQASVNNSGSTFIQDVTIDTYGHVTGLTSVAVPTLNQDTTGSAATLTNAREFRTNLGSTSAASFDGSANVSPGVTGTLAVGNGGTGNTSGNAAGLTASTSNSIGVGSIELGHADDTTIARNSAGVITVEGKEVRTVDRQIQAVYSSFQADDINTKHYIAFNDGDSENTASTNVDLPIVAPYAGKLLTVSIRQSRNTSTHTYTLRLETQAAGVPFATGPTIVGTQSGSAPTNTSMVTYDFTSSLDSGDNIIDAGDVVFVSLQSSDAPGGSTKYFITCLFEWDYSSLT